MRPLTIDKIASVTRSCGIGRHVHVSDQIDSRSGSVVAVRILNSKAQYDKLELVSGRMSTLVPGDVIVGALGHRAALRGFSGHCPNELAVGDRIQVLNLGGVLGIVDAGSPTVGHPFEAEVLGQVLSFPVIGERVGVPAHIARNARPFIDALDVRGVPVVVVAGTSMDAGKTAACSAIVKALTRQGLKVSGAKATGVSLRRDILAMEDAGARETLLFTDFGVVTTTAAESVAIVRSELTALAAGQPDVILLELGDGLHGDYGVDAILRDEALRDAFSAVVLCAGDPVGAWGGVRWMQDEYGITPAVLSGPCTDNPVGAKAIARTTGLKAINARTEGEELTAHVWAVAKDASRG